MRISDWSSDVCSSDLPPIELLLRDIHCSEISINRTCQSFTRPVAPACHGADRCPPPRRGKTASGLRRLFDLAARSDNRRAGAGRGQQALRSEEHPSEIQSLMRISYAGFCLEKKK